MAGRSVPHDAGGRARPVDGVDGRPRRAAVSGAAPARAAPRGRDGPREPATCGGGDRRMDGGDGRNHRDGRTAASECPGLRRRDPAPAGPCDVRRSSQGRRTAGLRQIATALLRAAGLEQGSADLGTATTRSLDAYRAYLRGMAHLNRAEYRQARDALLDAVRIDSAFAQAYGKLAEVSLLAFSVLARAPTPHAS